MKKAALVAFTMVVSQLVLGQGAGNYVMNQKKSGKSYRSQQLGYFEQNNAIRGGTGTYQWSAPGTSYVNDSTIEVTTNVMMNVEADSYIAIFGVTQIGETVDEGHKQIDERINKFISTLNSKGIEESDIHVDFISQIPVYEANVEKKLFSKSYNEIPAGFELQKNIHVHVKSGEVVEDILQEAAKHEIYDIIKVDYIILDIDAIYDTLRNTAIDQLNAKVKTFKRLGIQYNALFQTMRESYGSVYPIERYSTYFSFVNAKIRSESRSGSDTRRVSQSDALYYDKIPYNNFEVILNPEEVKPSVQYMYTLSMKYVLKRNP